MSSGSAAIAKEQKIRLNIIENEKQLLEIDTYVSLARLSYNCYVAKYFEGTIKYGAMALEKTPTWSQLNQESRDATISLLMMMGYSYYHLDDYENAIEWVVKCVELYSELMNQTLVSSDPFISHSPINWNGLWMRLKWALDDTSKFKKLTITEIARHLNMPFSNPLAVLRKEINILFCDKISKCEELVYAGDELEEIATHYTDKALGLLAQAVGLWWGSEAQEVEALSTIRRALQIINDGIEKNKTVEVHSSITSILCAILTIWHGLCLTKIYQRRAADDLNTARALDKETNPDRYKGISNVLERVVPGITSFTLKEEETIANLLIRGLDILFETVQLKQRYAERWIQHIGPGIVTVTVRLLCHRMAILGDTYNSIRAWYTAFTLGSWYSMPKLVILSGCELMKIVPFVDGKIKQDVVAAKIRVDHYFGHNPSTPFHTLGFELAESIACLKKKQFTQGLENLKKVLDIKSLANNIDVCNHTIAEAEFVLAQYKCMVDEDKIKKALGDQHVHLLNMSSGALARKACKTLTSLARPTDIECTGGSGGWLSLYHNYHILQTVMEMYPTTIELTKKAGKVRDARALAADSIYLAQQLCLTSRTIQLLLPLIEMELQTSAFDVCFSKIESVFRMMDCYKKDKPETNNGFAAPRPSRVSACKVLRAMGITSKQEELTKLIYEWEMPEITLPEYHFGVMWKSDGGTNVDEYRVQTVEIPKYLLHSHDCSCYLCGHAFLGILTVRFLIMQSKYLCCARRVKQSLTLMQCARCYMVRAISRTAYKFFQLGSTLKVVTDQGGLKYVIDSIQTPQLFNTAFYFGMTFMEITPYQDIEMTIRLYNFLTEVIKLFGHKDEFTYLFPLEVVVAAIFAYMKYHNLITIQGIGIREEFRTARPIRRLPPLSC